MAVLFLVLAIGVLLVSVRSPRQLLARRGLAFVGVIAAAEAVTLTWYVLSDDPNVADHRPRWDFYQGGATHALYWTAVALDAVAITLAGLAILGKSPRIGHSNSIAYAAATALVSGLGAGAASIYGFSLT